MVFLGIEPIARMLMLTVWGRRTSSNVQALMWCIGEQGLACERHDAGHIYGVTYTAALLAMNPNGTVPVLRDDDGEPLWETGALLRYYDIAITRPERPALRRYYDALTTRPAFREHVMTPYEELRVVH